MNNLTKYAAMLGLILGWFCSGCGKNVLESATPDPIDCQKFLDKYFEAIKSKDVGKIKELSSYVSNADREGMPARGIDMLRESKRAPALSRPRSQIARHTRAHIVAAARLEVVASDLPGHR